MFGRIVKRPSLIQDTLSTAIVRDNLCTNIVILLAICRAQLDGKVKALCQVTKITGNLLVNHNIMNQITAILSFTIGVGKCIIASDLFINCTKSSTICVLTVQLCIINEIATHRCVICNGNRKITLSIIVPNTQDFLRILRNILSNFKDILTGASGQIEILNLNSQILSAHCICIGSSNRIKMHRISFTSKGTTITIRLALIRHISSSKAKVHIRRSALQDFIVLHNLQRIISENSCSRTSCTFASASLRKRSSCADGEHHGGSQNAREEFLQFHCYSSLVRNSSYSCAATQTPRFTGRMPAASSGFRGITDCVAAVV